MEKVVYFLGAGFSAPLGIPTMRNFFEKSKDMYFNDKVQYKHFLQVINTFNEYNLIKSFYDSGLFNIEELLSILEISGRLKRGTLKKIFLQYISDVITYYTPPLEPKYISLSSVESALEQAGKWNNYLKFVASLLNLSFNLDIYKHPTYGKLRYHWLYKANEFSYQYNIITLNYDRVIENCIEYLNHFPSESDLKLRISRLPSSREEYPCDIYLAKLHGSINEKSIVPPTWNKSLRADIKSYWALASNLLKEANHIRFIGYSLPDSDAYVKYLLKSSITLDQHLKSIDVICYDPDGEVKRRYDKFIVFPNYRFLSVKTEKYLSSKFGQSSTNFIRGNPVHYFSYTNLEVCHEQFFTNQL